MRGSIISVVEGSEGNYNQNRSWQEIRDCRPDFSKSIYTLNQRINRVYRRKLMKLLSITPNYFEMRCHDSELCFISPHDGVPLRFRLIF